VHTGCARAPDGNIVFTVAYDDDTTTRHMNPIYEKEDWYKGFDVVIHDECTADVNKDEQVATVLKPHKDGLPGIVLHCGMHCYRTADWNKKGGVTPWFEFTGLQTTGHGAQLPIALHFVDTASPITKGMEDWTTINEELYNNFNDGKLFTTLKGDHIVEEFQVILDEYVEKRYGRQPVEV